MHCVLAWFGMLARGFLVASDKSISFDPGSACLGLFANGVLCLYAQDPVAFLVWLRTKHACTCDGHSLDSSCLGQVASTVLELSS